MQEGLSAGQYVASNSGAQFGLAQAVGKVSRAGAIDEAICIAEKQVALLNDRIGALEERLQQALSPRNEATGGRGELPCAPVPANLSARIRIHANDIGNATSRIGALLDALEL